MSPSSPAAPRWHLARTITASATGALIIIYTVLLAAADLDPKGAASRILFVSIVVAIVITVAFDRRANTEDVKRHLDVVAEEVKAHVDERVFEVAGRMDRRMTAIGNAMIEHGIALDDTTGEIARVRQAIAHHSHPEYGQVAKTQRVMARAVVVTQDPSHGLDPHVLEMGRRISERMHGE